MSAKNILILSHRDDASTLEVMDWIRYYGFTPLRLNMDEEKGLEIGFQLTNEDSMVELKVDGNWISSKEIRGYWYRRGGLPRFRNDYKEWSIWDDRELKKKVDRQLFQEKEEIYRILHYYLEKEKDIPVKLGTYFNRVSKLIVFDRAREVGFKIPKSILTNRLNYFEKQKNGGDRNWVTKGVKEGIRGNSRKQFINAYTEKLSENDQRELPGSFFPSLFQENIEKAYEIRVTYIRGECYSMAIFSQNDDQTKIDFRKYNWSNPNRKTPYQLPGNIQKNISRLMNLLDLDFGSLDFVKGVDGAYYFLEVNPVGQFGMVSEPCNYGIEKRIAQYLTQQL